MLVGSESELKKKILYVCKRPDIYCNSTLKTQDAEAGDLCDMSPSLPGPHSEFWVRAMH